MNTIPRKTARHPFSIPYAAAVVALLSIGLLNAQETLRQQVEEGDAHWIVGKWTGTNNEGRQVTVEYEWELDGHALEVDLELGRGAYKGMIVKQPVEGKVIETGADNGGGITRAIWREEDGLLISERTSTRPGGEVSRIAVVNEKIDADTIKATVHSLSADGEIGKEVIDTVKLTRVATAPDKD